MKYLLVQKLVKETDRKPFFVLAASISVVIAVLWVRDVTKKSKGLNTKGVKEIPVPEGEHFYLGHTHMFVNGISSQVNKWHKQLGPLFLIKMATKNWLFIGDPKIAHDIFVVKGLASSGRPYLRYGRDIYSRGHRGIVFMDNDKVWKKSRSAAGNALSPKFIDSIHNLIDTEVGKAIDLLISEYIKSPEERVCPVTYTRLSSMNLALSIFFGLPSVSSAKAPIFKQLYHIIQKHVEFVNIVKDQSYPFFSFLSFFYKRERQTKHFAYNELYPFYRTLIKKGRESTQPSLTKKLDELRKSADMDEDSMIIILSDLIVGAVDTISYAMSFSLATLCHHPEWQRKIAREIDDFVKKNNRMPMYTERQHLPITLAVMKEMFRYRSSSSLGLAHRATEDIVYQDYIIPKDTILISNNVTTNHSSSFFKEPEKFNPERFLGDIRSLHSSSNGNINNREVFTFGWGRRICPGIYLSETEIFCWMCHLFYRCTVEPIVSSTGEKVYPDIDSLIEYGGIIAPVPFEVRLALRRK
ncbi:cytochrome P450 [Sporodiniella umbellata]|nr:cytochrome P450 [Sporodiniella umbellata]